MIILPFEAAHLSLFINRETGDYGNSIGEHNGPAFTAFTDDGTPIGSAGVVTQLPAGVGIAWAYFSDKVAKHPLEVSRLTRRILDDTFTNLNLHQIDSAVVAGNTRNGRWLEHLGFQKQGTYTRYTKVK